MNKRVEVINNIDTDLAENGSRMNKIVDCCYVPFHYSSNVCYQSNVYPFKKRIELATTETQTVSCAGYRINF